MMTHGLPALATLLVGLLAGPALQDADDAAAGQSPPPGEAGDSLGEYVRFPAAAVEIRRPEGFEVSDSFDGFGMPSASASVIATRIPGPFAEVTAGFDGERMAAQGWYLLERREIRVGDLPGLLVHFAQPAGGTLFVKWFVAFGDEEATTLVAASFPRDREEELSDRLKAAVLSARPAVGPVPPPGSSLPFTLRDSEVLKPATEMNRAVLYTPDGSFPVESPAAPFLVAASSIGEVAVDDPRAFAERRLRGMDAVKAIAIESTEAAVVDGLEGFETIATAEDADTGTPLVLYQLILFDDGSYLLLQGAVGREARDATLPEFRSLARSLKRRRP